ncbi:MAG: leucine-rich repeat protein [Muribaculaceae bacterium]|nr:leucine-rich repeat protein [Muribaculaceae bacterium]
MTSTLLKQVERLRYLAILLLSVCAFGTAHAQLSSDEISEAILVEGSVPVRWTNDAEHPWYIDTDGNGSYVRTPSNPDDTEMTSSLSFEYTSSYPTEITFSHGWRWDYTNDHLKLFIDGEDVGVKDNYEWSYLPDGSQKYLLPDGSHTIEFIGNFVTSRSHYYYSSIRNLKVMECKELETACLKDGSLPLTFTNESDLDKTWVTDNGFVRSQMCTPDEITKISTTFTIDKPALFAYDMKVGQGNGYFQCQAYMDGVLYSTNGSSDTWASASVVLYPGTHTVEFVGDNSDSYYDNYMMLRDVCLHQNWYEVTLNNPGELGTRLTQVMEGRPIQEMELLKIHGAMNSDDWEKIQLPTSIKAIDFTDAKFTAIPDGACRDLQVLSTVMLPETLKTIGNEAFRNTNFYQVSIPASVESIGDVAWGRSNLMYIDFEEGSNLKTIGHSAFAGTRLIEFDMPDSVETLGYGWIYNDYSTRGSSIFYECTSLKRLHLSDGLTDLRGRIAQYCYSLEDVNIPKNLKRIDVCDFHRTNIKKIILPESLEYIGSEAFSYSALEEITIPKNVVTLGEYAFEHCENMKTAHLNSHCCNMYMNFAFCISLEKIVLPCATPPTIYNSSYEPFFGVNKSQVQLVVPDFAFDTYRADSYWYWFTNTVKGDEASINDYWAIRGTLNLNNTLAMQGNPSVEMMEGGVLTLDSDSNQTFDEFTYNTSEGAPSVVLSQSNTVSAGRLVSKFYVPDYDRWYFFSPVTDVNMSEVSYPATDSWVIRYYDGARRASEDATSGNWINVPADGTLKAGQGYIIQARSAGWLYLPAASTAENDKFFGANAVTFDLADNACETEANAGWNFVANPYPTYYDIYYIDMQAPITVWDGSTYRAYSLNDGDRGDDTFVLRPMQPFFVQKATADLSTGMPLVGRQVNTTIDRSRAPRPIVKDENRQKLNLELYCNDNETADDYTRVVLNEQASLGYETVRDASKFMSMDANVAQLYTLGENNHPMAINERPYEDGNVALGVLLPATDRTYRIAALRADRQTWLYDAETGIEFDLTDGDYIFSASKTGIDNKRFSIRFASATTAVEGVDATAVKVAGNVGSISVTAPAGAAVAVFGTDGSIVTNTTAENGTLEISVAGGVYVVKVNGKSFKTIVK